MGEIVGCFPARCLSDCSINRKPARDEPFSPAREPRFGDLHGKKQMARLLAPTPRINTEVELVDGLGAAAAAATVAASSSSTGVGVNSNSFYKSPSTPFQRDRCCRRGSSLALFERCDKAMRFSGVSLKGKTARASPRSAIASSLVTVEATVVECRQYLPHRTPT